jgi:HemY protein
MKGYLAISRGLIAIGAGDLRAARRFAGEARRFAADEPLALLLAAQTAQLAGNRPAAEVAFRKMADHGETRLLGLHGLFVEAQRRNDLAAARAVAEEAVKANPAAGWAAQAVLDFRCAQGDWAGALTALDSNMKSGLIDKTPSLGSRAPCCSPRGALGRRPRAARADVLEAVQLSPGLVPAAALVGRLLAEAGDARKAARVLEAAWRANPHPDLAWTYAHVRPGVRRATAARVQSLRSRIPTIRKARWRWRAPRTMRGSFRRRARLWRRAPLPTQRVAGDDGRDRGRRHRRRRPRANRPRALHAARDPS